MNSQRPRWKAEADACIAHHKLAIYGDPYAYVSGDDILLGALERIRIVRDRIADDISAPQK